MVVALFVAWCLILCASFTLLALGLLLLVDAIGSFITALSLVNTHTHTLAMGMDGLVVFVCLIRFIIWNQLTHTHTHEHTEVLRTWHRVVGSLPFERARVVRSLGNSEHLFLCTWHRIAFWSHMAANAPFCPHDYITRCYYSFYISNAKANQLKSIYTRNREDGVGLLGRLTQLEARMMVALA